MSELNVGDAVEYALSNQYTNTGTIMEVNPIGSVLEYLVRWPDASEAWYLERYLTKVGDSHA